MAEKKSEGFQSGAGLIRYFEEEEISGPALDPKLIKPVIFARILVGKVEDSHYVLFF